MMRSNFPIFAMLALFTFPPLCNVDQSYPFTLLMTLGLGLKLSWKKQAQEVCFSFLFPILLFHFNNLNCLRGKSTWSCHVDLSDMQQTVQLWILTSSWREKNMDSSSRQHFTLISLLLWPLEMPFPVLCQQQHPTLVCCSQFKTPVCDVPECDVFRAWIWL